MEIIRVAIIGSGIFMRETYIPNIDANKSRVKLTAVLSRNVESIDDALRQSSDHGENVLRFFGDSGEDMFFSQAKDICDAVIIVVPIPLLSKYIERCLKLDLHILSEKPVAMTSTVAKDLIETYRSNSFCSYWHVAENYRLEPAVRYASMLVQTRPTPPKSFSLTALRQQSASSKYAVTSWRAKPEYNGSFVLDGGIHFVALLRAVLGGVVSDIQAIYEERSVVEVGTCGACRVGDALGTFHIRYGAFLSVLCRLDIFWDDASMSIIQHKGIGYEVMMTNEETKHFGFEGIELEFKEWLDTINGNPCALLSPEESLMDLLVVEKMCGTQKQPSSI